ALREKGVEAVRPPVSGSPQLLPQLGERVTQKASVLRIAPRGKAVPPRGALLVVKHFEFPQRFRRGGIAEDAVVGHPGMQLLRQPARTQVFLLEAPPEEREKRSLGAVHTQLTAPARRQKRLQEV